MSRLRTSGPNVLGKRGEPADVSLTLRLRLWSATRRGGGLTWDEGVPNVGSALHE